MPENIIQIDQNLLETRLDRLVAEKVAELLNAMLDAEADEIANAAKYERTGERKAYRAGHYDRSLTAKAGRLALKVPQTQGRGLRVRSHRTIPRDPRGECRGGPHRRCTRPA